MFLQKKLNNFNSSSLENDMEEFNDFKIKKYSRFEKLKRNVLLLKLFQRIIIDQQISFVNENIYNLLQLKENYIKQKFFHKNQEL